MFTLKFRQSRSKNYKLVLSLAKKFSTHRLEEDTHVIDLSIHEVFEKWCFFNLIFWRTVDWKEQTFGFDGWNLHAHPEKTRIFYALQDAYIKWICISEEYIKRLAPAYFDNSLTKKIRANSFSEKNVDYLLDSIRIAKYQEIYNREYGNLPKEIHFRISDFKRKRAVLKSMEEEERTKEEGF